MDEFIGRQSELEKLSVVAESNASEFVAIYGRRRVGKTMLVRNYFKDQFSFQATGIANSTLKNQLKIFMREHKHGIRQRTKEM